MGRIVNGLYYPDDQTRDIPEVAGGYEEDRKQSQRDRFRRDLLQPRIAGRYNPDYFKAYPQQVETYKLSNEERRDMGL